MHILSLFNILVATTALIPTATALGINCAGSTNCNQLVGSKQIALSLTKAIDNIDPKKWYDNGQLIACAGGARVLGNGGFCAFLQNTRGTTGAVIKNLAHYIPEHGCRVCGSVPYYYPQGDNNVANGELTYNFVANSCSQDEAKLC